jgi:glycosyltransferase involved in cell wall biosynthesis
VRIAVVNNFYPPRVGGSAHLAQALARGYAKAGHEVLVVTAAYQDAPAWEADGAVRVVRLPAFTLPETRLALSFDISFATRPSLPGRLRRLLDGFRPDVIHQHGQFFDLSWATGLYARRRGVPVLLSVHTRLENPTALYGRALGLVDRLLVAPILGLYRPRTVVMDRAMDRYIHRHYARACRPLEYIPVGVDLEAVRGGDAGRAYEALGLAPGTPLIVSVGHVIPLRDRLALVEAMPAVLAAVPDAKCVVVGRVYYDLFLRRARELGVEQAVLAPGPVPKERVADFLAAAAVESHEQGYGMGTATLEAMAAGGPVVALAEPDYFPTLPLVDREHCYLVPPQHPERMAPALVEALTQPDRAAAIGAAGRSLVERHFSLDTVVDQHVEVLEDMVRRGAGGRGTGS